ncbi:MAG TPA: ATP-binding protein [Fimbriimonadaceae bacterium]|nr:ATP-binding protein [Fimbriimonadaceae bacterium]
MIKTRLTVWNCVILSLVLTAIGIAIYITTRETVLGGVDSSLEERGQFFAAGWHGKPPQGPPQFPDGRNIFGDHRGPPMDPSQMRPLGIDPGQMRTVQAMNETLLPMVLSLDGRDVVNADRKPWDLAGFQKAKAGNLTFGLAIQEGLPLRILSIPLLEHGKITGVTQLAAPIQSQEEELANLARTLEIVLPLAVLAMLMTGVFLTRRALQPIAQIASAAERIEATNLSDRLPVCGKDEFAQLSGTFNSMLDGLEEAFHGKDEAYNRQRQFISDASHELKTPLTAIRARTGIALRKDLESAKYKEHLQAIDRASSLMTAIVQDLLFLAASDEGRLELHRVEADVAELVRDALASVDVNRHKIETDLAAGLTTCVDVAAMTRVFVNLIENAVRHTPEDKGIAVRSSRSERGVEVTVADRGRGIPAEHVPLIFDRFHRVDRARDRDSGGSGLGLAIAKAIVEAHGGTISLVSEEGAGTTVAVIIPSAIDAGSTS